MIFRDGSSLKIPHVFLRTWNSCNDVTHLIRGAYGVCTSKIRENEVPINLTGKRLDDKEQMTIIPELPNAYTIVCRGITLCIVLKIDRERRRVS